jgi:hypothetical protein
MLNLECYKSKHVVFSHEVASAKGRSLVQQNPGECVCVCVCMCERERMLYKPELLKTVAEGQVELQECLLQFSAESFVVFIEK